MVKRNLLTTEQGKCKRSKNRAIKDTLSVEHLFYSHLGSSAEFFIMSLLLPFSDPALLLVLKMSVISLGMNANQVI